MSITIQLDLPDALIGEARDKGLFQSEQLGNLLTMELRRRRAAEDLQQALAAIRTQPGQPAAAFEIMAEVKAARAELRHREAGR